MGRIPFPLILLALALLVGAALGFNALYQQRLEQVAEEGSAESAARLVGRPRPDFSFPDLNGFPREAAEWDGRVLVVNFWASWCRPCRREIPAFVRLQARYGTEGAQFIGIALDNREAVRDFLKELEVSVNYPILIGEDDAIDTARAYGNGLGVLPYTVLVDREGKIRHLQYGEMSEAQVETQLRQLL